MPRRRRLCLLFFTAWSCSDRDPPELGIPNLGADYLVYATAAEGRGANPTSVRIARAADIKILSPEAIGGGFVDMFVAGLAADDLPKDLNPTALKFVEDSAPHARRLPALKKPHVLEEPGLPTDPNRFVPAVDDSIPASLLTERKERLDTMLRNLAIEDPCVEAPLPIQVTTPRTSADGVTTFRTLSSGETFIGFAATSTAIMGALRPGSEDLEIIGVDTGSAAIGRSERVRIADLGDREVTNRQGRILPASLAINFIGGFGAGIGQLSLWSAPANKYVDSSPRMIEGTSAVPAVILGGRYVTLDGVPHLCTFGSVQGPNRVAGIFCKTRTSTSARWKASGLFPDGFMMFELLQQSGAPALSVDLTGTVYEHGNGEWSPSFRARINEGCNPPCVLFSAITSPEQPGSSIVTALAGAEAQAIVVKKTPAGRLEVAAVPAITNTTFADERRGSETALRFSAITVGPDGAIWLGAYSSVLFRVEPDLEHATRICLPDGARDTEVGAIAALPDGRLIIGTTPVLMGFGRWL